MSFPAYAEYKDSGVPWMGDIPVEWDVIQGRRLFAQKRDPSEPDDEQLSATQKYGVLPQSKFMELEDKKVTLALTGLEGFKQVLVNDFVISLRSFQGGIEHSPYSGCASPAYTILRPNESVHPPFWKYLLKSVGYIEALQSVTDGIRDGKNISYEQFGKVCVPDFPLPEQRTIASFLDTETSKIDGLVSEQRRLIELLKEKRQAVISRAVTKGLDPSVKMKESGIEWLGEVPEHWTATKLKHLGQAKIGLTYSPADVVDEDDSDGTLVLRSSNVQGGSVVYDNNVFVRTEIPDSLRTQEGDILVCSRNGSRALIGKNAMIDVEAAGLTFGAFMTVYRSDRNRYLYWVFNSQLFELQSASFLTATINQLTVGNLNGFDVLLPPLPEQRTIASFLDTETDKFDSLITQAERAIELLQERRTALISAAVTGKIDVRSYTK